MNDVKGKTSFLGNMKLIGFGFKTAHKLLPAYFPCTLLRSFITSAQPLIVLFFSAQILNELAEEQNINRIVLFVSLTLGITFVLSVIRAILVREIDSSAGMDQALRRLDMMEAEQYATMDYAHTEDSSVGEMLARIHMYARSSGRGIVNIYLVAPEIISSFISIALAFTLLTDVFSIGGTGMGSSWGRIVLLGLYVVGLFITIRLQVRNNRKLQKIIALAAGIDTMANYYYEYVNVDQAAKDIRIYNQKDLLMKITKESFSSPPWISYFFSVGRSTGFQFGILAVIGGGLYLLVGNNALDGVVPVGSIVQTVGAATAIAMGLGSFTANMTEIYNNAPFIEPIKDYLSLPGFLHNGTKSVDLSDTHEHQIEFRNVSFRYPGSENYALKNLNLKFIPTERLAVVGLNGSGKTTMIKLLCRLYDPTEGEILLDGINIKEYNYEQYHALFSVVFQDNVLFPLRLGQNVAVDSDYDARGVEQTLSDSGFTDRLDKMPDGPDTFLYKEYDEDGTQISGGEAQKIALARALYRNAPIVVLDEPTAALDPIAEYEVYTTFDKTIGNKTAVFISHRLSSCRFCQRIAVFDEGNLIQLGTHENLLEDTSGRYYELWEAQASHYRED
ncbi:MAG: ABC transporter ATP-binding protein/permease [Oscillospiraceae bacterium]|nr:ABC transporter ATP-binding protein/permease [Oscillospiraceae bacterium]